jgi:hypothetical protein
MRSLVWVERMVTLGGGDALSVNSSLLDAGIMYRYVSAAPESKGLWGGVLC